MIDLIERLGRILVLFGDGLQFGEQLLAVGVEKRVAADFQALSNFVGDVVREGELPTRSAYPLTQGWPKLVGCAAAQLC